MRDGTLLLPTAVDLPREEEAELERRTEVIVATIRHALGDDDQNEVQLRRWLPGCHVVDGAGRLEPIADAADRCRFLATNADGRLRRTGHSESRLSLLVEASPPPPPTLQRSQSSLQLLVAAARHVLDPDAATRAFQTETQSAALHADAHHELDGFVRPAASESSPTRLSRFGTGPLSRRSTAARTIPSRYPMMMITKRRRRSSSARRNIHGQRRRTTCTTSSSRLTAARSSTTRPTSGAAHSRTRTSRACRRRGPRPQSGPRPTARRCADRSRAANSPACDPPPLLSLSKFVSCIDDEPDLWSLEASVLQALASMRTPATSKYSHGAAIAIT